MVFLTFVVIILRDLKQNGAFDGMTISCPSSLPL